MRSVGLEIEPSVEQVAKDKRIKSLEDDIAWRNGAMMAMQERLAQIGGPKELDPIELEDGKVIIVEQDADASSGSFLRRLYSKLKEPI